MDNECPFCAAGVPTTQYHMIPLLDPATGEPTGQHWKVSQSTYDKIMELTHTK